MSKIPYNHKAIEKKWRDKWEENPVNEIGRAHV